MKESMYMSLFVDISRFSKQKMINDEGLVQLEATVRSFQNCPLEKNSIIAIFDLQNDEFSAMIMVEGYWFKNALRQNGLLDDCIVFSELPKAVLELELDGLVLDQWPHLSSDIKCRGELSFQGVTQIINTVPIKINATETQLILSSKF